MKREMFKRGDRRSGLKLSDGHRRRPGAHGRSAEEIIYRVPARRTAGVDVVGTLHLVSTPIVESGGPHRIDRRRLERDLVRAPTGDPPCTEHHGAAAASSSS